MYGPVIGIPVFSQEIASASEHGLRAQTPGVFEYTLEGVGALPLAEVNNPG
jgi:hypothetical protein